MLLKVFASVCPYNPFLGLLLRSLRWAGSARLDNKLKIPAWFRFGSKGFGISKLKSAWPQKEEGFPRWTRYPYLDPFGNIWTNIVPFGVIFKTPNFPHSISCTEAQWFVDKVMIEHSLHSVLICDIHTARFPLDCSRAAVCTCTLFRVCCRPHSEGCVSHVDTFKHYF